MKITVSIILLIIQITAFSQEDDYITFQTEKEVYKVGELVTAHLASEKSFVLMTTGDCGGNVLPPSFIKQIDSKWQELYPPKQMCCGLPYTMDAMNEMDAEMTFLAKGIYKIVVYIYGKVVVSNAFEVLE